MRISKLAALMVSAAVLSILPMTAAHAEDAGTNTDPATTSEVSKSGIVVTGINGRVDTAVFGKRPFMRAPRLSPDGTKIAVMMSRNGIDNLGWIDVTKPGSAPVFFLAAEEQREVGDRSVNSWRWVGNRTIV